MPEADRQYVSFHSKKERVGRNKQRRKSLQSDPVTDERLHRIEKTLREMQLKLDEVSFDHLAINLLLSLPQKLPHKSKMACSGDYRLYLLQIKYLCFFGTYFGDCTLNKISLAKSKIFLGTVAEF